ncbi:hypothetical protein Taro_010615 [Colocasia esculenta]|uniref:Uncharacterized protein n=1 Tax=Colocasia esculenta TaxID=4460 RepID=A0A843U7G5_COLES|nr:hypothetical protein [Colocasia esculenta]
MREIVTIQVGTFANYVGSHFWNFQDELLGLAEEANGDPIYKSPSLDMDVLYRAGETQQVPLVLYLLLVNYMMRFHPLIRQMLSHGDVLKHVSEPRKKNIFLQRLCEEEQPNHNVPTNHVEKSADTPDVGLQDKDLVACLENEVHFWTDFSKVHYHPQSLYELHGSWTTAQEFDNYGIGREFFSGSFHEEEVNERLRFFVEECDHIQGIQFILDDYGGFSSVAADFLEHIADEYPNKPVLLYSARGPGGCKNATSKRASIKKVLHDAVSFSRLSSLCKLMVPLGLPSLSTSKVSAFLRVDDSKPFHCSAVYAASIHSLSLPFRMDPPGPTENCVYITGAMDVWGLVQMLTGQARQNTVAILDTAIPAPCLKGDSVHGPFMRNLHPLTPETAVDGEDPQAVESLVVHGALSSGLRASISEVKDSVYSAYQHGLPKPMFLHLSAALCPLPIPLPFPSIFGNLVGQHGELLGNPIQGNIPRGSLDVDSIPMAARLRSSSAILPFIQTRSDNLGRYGIERGAAGTQLLRDWGFAKDEVEDMGESLSRMLTSLNPHVETLSDSD